MEILWINDTDGIGNFQGYNFPIKRLTDGRGKNTFPNYIIGYYNIVFVWRSYDGYELKILGIKCKRKLYERYTNCKITSDEICCPGPELHKGTWLLQLTFELVKYLKMKHITFCDMSSIVINKESYVRLRVLNAFLGKKSWYEKYGALNVNEHIDDIRQELYSYPFNLVKEHLQEDKDYEILGEYMKSIISISLENYIKALEKLCENEIIAHYVSKLSSVEMIYYPK